MKLKLDENLGEIGAAALSSERALRECAKGWRVANSGLAPSQPFAH